MISIMMRGGGVQRYKIPFSKFTQLGSEPQKLPLQTLAEHLTYVLTSQFPAGQGPGPNTSPFTWQMLGSECFCGH